MASFWPSSRQRRRSRRLVGVFLNRAYTNNLLGLAAMLAYNLLLSLFSFALIALFIAGRVLQSPTLEKSVVSDLADLFPSVTTQAINNVLDGVRTTSLTLGILSVLASIWISSSFWGGLDTAFCRIYHVRCRNWVEQKRFALGMFVVMIVFIAITVFGPALQSTIGASARSLSLGVSETKSLVLWVSSAVGLLILFGLLCLIYWTVPNRLVPWRAIWPGASITTVLIGGLAYLFPLYLSRLSTLSQLKTQFVFVLIALVWFFAIALSILCGAVANAMRFEMHDTGSLRVG
jgi:YihY family inner membrane protein